MEIQSAFSSGLQGFQKADEDASKAASDIAASTSYRSESLQQSETTATAQLQTQTQPDLTQSIVDLKVAEFQAKGSANVIKTADETLGTLLDVRV